MAWKSGVPSSNAPPSAIPAICRELDHIAELANELLWIAPLGRITPHFW